LAATDGARGATLHPAAPQCASEPLELAQSARGLPLQRAACSALR